MLKSPSQLVFSSTWACFSFSSSSQRSPRRGSLRLHALHWELLSGSLVWGTFFLVCFCYSCTCSSSAVNSSSSPATANTYPPLVYGISAPTSRTGEIKVLTEIRGKPRTGTGIKYRYFPFRLFIAMQHNTAVAYFPPPTHKLYTGSNLYFAS